MEPKPLPESEKAVGIDLGTNPNFLITSEGEMVEAPRYFHKVQKKLANAQRNLTRKKRGSHRRKQARRRVARLHRKVANQRRDFHHKLARSLVNRYGTIVHEDLNILGLARSNTAKGVQDAGWAQFLQILAYKAAEAGRRVIGVDPRHTSQDCPVCGHREKRPLWIREYTCPQCGTPLHRDVAAAQNVLARARTEPSGTETARAAPLCPRSPALKSGESSREREDGLLCRAEPTQENAWAFWLAAWRFESQVALDLGMRRANLERAFAALKERLPELPGSLLERSREAEDWGKEELRAFRRGE
jgi:putative transposase